MITIQSPKHSNSVLQIVDNYFIYVRNSSRKPDLEVKIFEIEDIYNLDKSIKQEHPIVKLFSKTSELENYLKKHNPLIDDFRQIFNKDFFNNSNWFIDIHKRGLVEFAFHFFGTKIKKQIFDLLTNPQSIYGEYLYYYAKHFISNKSQYKKLMNGINLESNLIQQLYQLSNNHSN